MSVVYVYVCYCYYHTKTLSGRPEDTLMTNSEIKINKPCVSYMIEYGRVIILYVVMAGQAE